jgi:hypothetical protein
MTETSNNKRLASAMEEAQQDEQDGDSTMGVDLSLLDAWTTAAKKKQQVKIHMPHKDPKDDPYSCEAFGARLQTFLPLTYYCKPTSLSPLVCARFGYVQGREATVVV